MLVLSVSETCYCARSWLPAPRGASAPADASTQRVGDTLHRQVMLSTTGGANAPADAGTRPVGDTLQQRNCVCEGNRITCLGTSHNLIKKHKSLFNVLNNLLILQLVFNPN